MNHAIGAMLDRFEKEGALWQLQSDHALHVKTSMSGQHVAAYFNSDIIVAQPKLVTAAVQEVLNPAIKQRTIKPDWVFTYAPYGMFVAYACAEQLQAKCGYVILSNNGSTTFNVRPGQKVLVVADDIYSGGGITKTIDTLESMNAVILPVIFCLANLSGKVKLGEREIIAGAHVPNQMYPADSCQLCTGGSKAVVPRENWPLLMGK